MRMYRLFCLHRMLMDVLLRILAESVVAAWRVGLPVACSITRITVRRITVAGIAVRHNRWHTEVRWWVIACWHTPWHTRHSWVERERLGRIIGCPVGMRMLDLMLVGGSYAHFATILAMVLLSIVMLRRAARFFLSILNLDAGARHISCLFRLLLVLRLFSDWVISRPSSLQDYALGGRGWYSNEVRCFYDVHLLLAHDSYE